MKRFATALLVASASLPGFAQAAVQYKCEDPTGFEVVMICRQQQS